MTKPTVTMADFLKLDLRVGKVIDATLVDKSNKLIKLIVDLGQDYGKKTILVGMQAYCQKEEFIGKKFIFVVNLESKKMLNEESQGMLLAADIEGKPVLINVPDNLSEGMIIR